MTEQTLKQFKKDTVNVTSKTGCHH